MDGWPKTRCNRLLILYIYVTRIETASMRRRRHLVASRLVPFEYLFVIVITTLASVLRMSTTRCVFVRSMSILVNSCQRSREATPLLYRSNSLIINVASQATSIMMLPFRTLVTNNDAASRRLLTRTMVHRMRLSELKDELERRGHGISGNNKAKRPDLIVLLLADISKSIDEEFEDDVGSAVPGIIATTGSSDRTNDEFRDDNKVLVPRVTDIIAVSSDQDDVSLENVGRKWVEQYPIRTLKLDPNTTYAITAIAVSKYPNVGNGIGITMRDINNNNIVWKAQKFYPKYRSIFETNYCAVILALRFATQFFMMSNVQIHVPNSIVHDQIVGKLIVTKPSLIQLLGQINQLLKADDKKGVQFQIAEAEFRNEAMSLAIDAFNTKDSLNVGEEDNDQLTTDPMDDVLTLTQAKIYEMKSLQSTEAAPGQKLALNGVNDLKAIETDDDPKFVLKYREFLKPEEVTINPALVYILRFDGGSRGNPGIAGAGMVLYDDHDREIWRGVKYLGRKMSNNLAEYTALNIGLSHALSIGIERIRCEGDSQLVVKQLNGIYKVKSDNLLDIFSQTQQIMHIFKFCEIHHIRREYNKRADALANQAMSTKTDYGL